MISRRYTKSQFVTSGQQDRPICAIFVEDIFSERRLKLEELFDEFECLRNLITKLLYSSDDLIENY